MNQNHRCKNMPINVDLNQTYTPTEISWGLKMTIYDNQKNSVDVLLKENIAYCPYCGEKLSWNFN